MFRLDVSVFFCRSLCSKIQSPDWLNDSLQFWTSVHNTKLRNFLRCCSPSMFLKTNPSGFSNRTILFQPTYKAAGQHSDPVDTGHRQFGFSFVSAPTRLRASSVARGLAPWHALTRPLLGPLTGAAPSVTTRTVTITRSFSGPPYPS